MTEAPTRPAPPGSTWLIDAALILLIAAGWVILVAYASHGRALLMPDTPRDMAWTHNILAGRIWADPSLPGYPYWYAPGNPLLMAGLARLTGASVTDLYVSSPYWLNLAIPLLVFALVRYAFDRGTAVAALATVFLGSYWWLTSGLAGMPSVQGLALNLATLLAWHATVRRIGGGQDANRRARPGGVGGIVWRAGLSGILLSASAWQHPLCGIMAAGAIFLHAVFAVLTAQREGARAAAWRIGLAMLGVGVVAAVLTAPLVRHLLLLPGTHAGPSHYIAGEVENPLFYAHAHAPLMGVFGLVGILVIARRRPDALWVLGYTAAGLLGYGMNLLALHHRWPLPVLLPHEFQWHWQVGLGICAAVGLTAAARGLPALYRPGAEAAARAHSRAANAVFAIALLGLLAAVVGPGLDDARLVLVAWSHTEAETRVSAAATQKVLRERPAAHGLDQQRRLAELGVWPFGLDELMARFGPAADWLRANSELDDVVLCDEVTALRVVAGLTGRKVVALPATHMNPAADAGARLRDLRTMLQTDDQQVFLRLARKYQVRFWLQPSAEAAPRRWRSLTPAFPGDEGRAAVYRVNAREVPSQAPPEADREAGPG